jgi:hypothetical protein
MADINPSDLLDTLETIAGQMKNGRAVSEEAVAAKLLRRMVRQLEENDLLRERDDIISIVADLSYQAAELEGVQPERWTKESIKSIVSMLDLASQMGFLDDDQLNRLQEAKGIVFSPRKAPAPVEGQPAYVRVLDKDGTVVLHRRASTKAAPKNVLSGVVAAGYTSKPAQDAVISVVTGQTDSAKGGGIVVEATDEAAKPGRKVR